MPSARNPADVGSVRRGAVLAAAVLAMGWSLTACAGSGPTRPGATSSSASNVTGSSSSESSGGPSLSTGAPIPTTGAVVTLQGTVTEGVETGCVVLTDDSGAVLANLIGLDKTANPLGSRVEVTGTFRTDLMTTCQQGPPFEVQTAVGR